MQRQAQPSYEANEALSHGTLFAGLDLPFMNSVNGLPSNDLLSQLQAVSFAAHELALYLDTHKDDREAFEMYKTFLKLKEEAKERYAEKHGADCTDDLIDAKNFTWTQDPWPWDYREE